MNSKSILISFTVFLSLLNFSLESNAINSDLSTKLIALNGTVSGSNQFKTADSFRKLQQKRQSRLIDEEDKAIILHELNRVSSHNEGLDHHHHHHHHLNRHLPEQLWPVPHKIIIDEYQRLPEPISIETPMLVHQPLEHQLFSYHTVHRSPVIVHNQIDAATNEPDFHVHPIESQYYHQGNGPVLVQMVSPKIRRKHDSSIPDLLAVLAPLAAIPLIGSLAVSSFTTMLTLTGMGKRRRRRDLGLHDKVMNYLQSSSPSSSQFDPISNQEFNFEMRNNFSMLQNDPKIQYRSQFDRQRAQTPFSSSSSSSPPMNTMKSSIVPISDLFQLDIVQQYLQKSGRPDQNDEIIASYLECRGMFAADNKCLERLACHYADLENGKLRPLERDVAAL
ncbi:hypothetical protein QR98_0083680 [Sarcoptes scabiei]|uniref:Uncharacterized protein n=1 Tax=Sarcoptes scabiei TaxID=52283 RepID=A0A132AFX1_SARSC|nr:hypothetical protein QR98_0083680 [Sarcoptes scabiei]